VDIVGDSYLGITSGLLVIRAQFERTACNRNLMDLTGGTP
jgi:hypothetical protein